MLLLYLSADFLLLSWQFPLRAGEGRVDEHHQKHLVHMGMEWLPSGIVVEKPKRGEDDLSVLLLEQIENYSNYTGWLYFA